MTEEFAITIENLNKSFSSFDINASFTERLINFFTIKNEKAHKVLCDINLNVSKGEFIGIIGKNGSGKSTLLKIILGAIKPDNGSKITTNGKLIRLALGIGFDVNLTARDNIYLNGTIIGLTLKEIGDKIEEIIEFAELQDFVDTPIRFYSSGMKSKLSFAIALHADAEIILIDEFFGAVGDNAFKEKSQKAFEENILKGKTIVHVSHSMKTIKNHCDKVLLLNRGRGQLFNDPMQAISTYKSL